MSRAIRSVVALALVSAAAVPAGRALGGDHYFFIRPESKKTAPIQQMSSVDDVTVGVQVFGTPGGLGDPRPHWRR